MQPAWRNRSGKICLVRNRDLLAAWGLSVGTAHIIAHGELKYRKVCARGVPRCVGKDITTCF
jgi:hypothetical protein